MLTSRHIHTFLCLLTTRTPCTYSKVLGTERVNMYRLTGTGLNKHLHFVHVTCTHVHVHVSGTCSSNGRHPGHEEQTHQPG